MNYGRSSLQKKLTFFTSNKIKKSRKRATIALKLTLMVLISFVVLGGFMTAGMVEGIIDASPKMSDISVSPSGYITKIYDSEGKEIERLVASGGNRTYISISEMPKNLQNAFIAIEDGNFWKHNGIDFSGIFRAGIIGITSGGDFSQGASTITQQLIKNNVFTSWTTESNLLEKIQRKIQEQYLAIQLEKQMSKEDILENYLNTINLGQNTLGVESAAERYFNKRASQLSLSECSVLATITQNPSRYNPVTHPDKNKIRREKVLKNMLEDDYISQSEYEDALNDDVYSRIQVVNDTTPVNSIYSYFIDEVINQVLEDLQEKKGYTQTQAYNALYSGGLTIQTTQDSEIQKICDEEFARKENYPETTKYRLTYRLTVSDANQTTSTLTESAVLEFLKEQGDSSANLNFSSKKAAGEAISAFRHALYESGEYVSYSNETITLTPQPQASITLMDQHTGEVKAIVGGRGKKTGSLTLNRASSTLRQPGSTFKILSTYAPAIDTAGYTLASTIDDAPYKYTNKQKVKNSYDEYKGLISIRDAIACSSNIVAVKVLTDITPQLGYDYLLQFGFTSLVDSKTLENGYVVSDINQALSLGGITYGVTNLELTAAYAAVANSGTYIKPRFYTRILDNSGNILIDNTPSTTAVLKESTAFLLTSAMEDVVKSGTAKDVSLGEMPVAGKTGTTSRYNDVWFSGYTPYYTCTIWGGYDNNEKLSKDSREYHKVLWKNIMTRVHEKLKVRNFDKPDNIVTKKVCAKSGKRAVKGVCDLDPRGSMIRTEYFTKGTTPSDTCDRHISVTICQASGMVANDYCPSWQKETKTFIVRPEGSKGTTADSEYSIVPSETCNIHHYVAPQPQPAAPAPPADNNPPAESGDSALDSLIIDTIQNSVNN